MSILVREILMYICLDRYERRHLMSTKCEFSTAAWVPERERSDSEKLKFYVLQIFTQKAL